MREFELLRSGKKNGRSGQMKTYAADAKEGLTTVNELEKIMGEMKARKYLIVIFNGRCFRRKNVSIFQG